jgi:glycosyltransferase involved in cell wall biosynthesis
VNFLLIHQLFIPPGEAGGTRHYELARHCIGKGHQVTIVASVLNYLSGEHVVKPEGLVTEESLDGIRLLRAYTLPVLHRSFVWRIVAFVSFMLTSIWAGLRAGKVDLVMGTSPPIFQAFSAWIVAVFRRKPFLLEIRDLWPEFAIDMGVLRNRLLISLSRWMESFLYARSSHLLVNSPAYRHYLLAKGVPDEKISVIPNGVDPDMFDPNGDGRCVRKRWSLDGRFVVTYAGALGMANDIQTLLRAADQLREDDRIHFLLVGDGKERANLEELTRQLALPNVTFTGSLPKSEMAEVLAASNACIAILKNISMFRTTYPNKVFDYMAAGRPTILAIDGVIRGVVEAAGGGLFVPPGDAQALADTISRLSREPDQAQQMGHAARDYVVKHFNRRQQATQFGELLERLISVRSRK